MPCLWLRPGEHAAKRPFKDRAEPDWGVLILESPWLNDTVVERVYIFNGGLFDYDKGHMTYGLNLGQHMTIFTPFMLIITKNEKILLDTGWSSGIVPVLEAMGLNPQIGPEHDVAACLKEAGLSPDDIDYIIMSHVHIDHDGGLRHFKGKRILVQRDEISYAGNPHPFAAIPYTRLDWEFTDYEWEALDGDTILSNGLAVILLNGHTPGTQGLLVNLPKRGPVLFTSDCCYLEENIEGDLIPGSVWSTMAAWHSLKKAKSLAGILGAALVPGHDPNYYGVEVPIFPEYLE